MPGGSCAAASSIRCLSNVCSIIWLRHPGSSTFLDCNVPRQDVSRGNVSLWRYHRRDDSPLVLGRVHAHGPTFRASCVFHSLGISPSTSSSRDLHSQADGQFSACTSLKIHPTHTQWKTLSVRVHPLQALSTVLTGLAHSYPPQNRSPEMPIGSGTPSWSVV